MAVDTRNKRVSIVAVSLPVRVGMLLPNGAVGSDDRLFIPYRYTGIAAGAGGGGPGGPAEWIVRARRRRKR